MRLQAMGSRLLAATLLVLAIGCGKGNSDRLPVYHTSGSVTVSGQPAAGARITLYGATADVQGVKAPIPTAEVQADGTFVLTSYEPGDGAPAGDFNVTISWPEEIPAGVDSEMYQRKDRLKGKHQDPVASGLKATVNKATTELPPFAL